MNPGNDHVVATLPKFKQGVSCVMGSWNIVGNETHLILGMKGATHGTQPGGVVVSDEQVGDENDDRIIVIVKVKGVIGVIEVQKMSYIVSTKGVCIWV